MTKRAKTSVAVVMDRLKKVAAVVTRAKRVRVEVKNPSLHRDEIE